MACCLNKSSSMASSSHEEEDTDNVIRRSTSTLSQYLHAQFETIINHKKPAREKIDFVERFNDFLHGNSKKENDGNGDGARDDTTTSQDFTNMFSPHIADVHLTIKPSSSSSLKPQINVATQINNGIQLPPINWNQQFRKGYSMLMWVRLHTPKASSAEDSRGSGSSPQKTDASFPEPQILYRFAQSSFPSAHGIQATLHRDTSAEPSEKHVSCIIRVETLRPPSPSKIDTSHMSHDHSNSLTSVPFVIPDNKWVLIGIQHSFPYLKRPTLTITIDGVEVSKGEVSYPTLGGELGDYMRDNYILCNIPSREKSNENGKQNGNHSRYMSSYLDIHAVDFAGFGLFKESIPTLIQGIISEHGPCYAADGVIPVVPPVVQNRDAIVMGGERQAIALAKQRAGAGTGPFGLSSNRAGDGAGGLGRGIGTPLCTGVMISSDGNYQGEVLLQKLLSKLVIGINVSRATYVDNDRVAIPISIGCSVGNTADVPKIGIVQPNEPHASAAPVSRRGRRKTPSSQEDGHVTLAAKCLGKIEIFNVTNEFLKSERRNKTSRFSIPSYNLPSAMVIEKRQIPSFLGTIEAVDLVGYLLQAFHLSLPPPGYPHNIQTKMYHDSFDYLYDLLGYRGGAFAAQLIQLFAAILSLGGRGREQVLHSGSLHVFFTLLRKVMLRATRLGMFSSKITTKSIPKSGNERLWQKYSSKETPDDELKDMHALKSSAPARIPELITKASCSIIAVCCGPILHDGRRWKRPSLPVHIRRASDLALTAIFGFALDLDIWGSDPVACSIILRQVNERYCSEDFTTESNMEIVEKFDSGYGRLLRFEISVQHLLDVARIRFGDELILSHVSGSEIQTANKSIASSLSNLLYMMLKYSLSSTKTISQGEHDVAAVVAALSDCQLGSIGCYAILAALRKLLVYCEVFPIHSEIRHRGTPDAEIISDILDGNGIKRSKNRNREADLKLKRIKSDMVGRLARNLLIGQFHEVISPLLLSRTIFDGRREINNSDASEESMKKTGRDTTTAYDPDDMEYHWQNAWRWVLHFFIWLTSVAGPGGAKAAQETGNLLLHSGKAGSLNGCLVTKDRMSLLRVIVPPFPSPTSAVPPGSYFDPSRDIMEIHMSDLCNRLKITVHMIGGITASLLSAKVGMEESCCVNRDAMQTLVAFIDGVVKITLYLFASNHSIAEKSVVDSRFQRRALPNVMDKPDVKIAIELAPPLVTAVMIFEDKIRKIRCKNYNSDSDSWDLVENNADSSSSEEVLPESQIGTLSRCLRKLVELVGVLITRAMMVGGGEASTIVWRNVIAAFDSGRSSKSNIGNGESKLQNIKDVAASSKAQVSSFISNNLLCRLTSTVLNLIVQRRSLLDVNPWESIELCSSTARLCDLVEEKKLLLVPFEGYNADALLPTSKHEHFTLDQVRLLCALLQVMESGRENTGWCQLDLPNPPTRLDSTGRQFQQEQPQKFYPSLVDAFSAFRNFSEQAEFVDYDLLAERDEIYHVQLSESNPAVNLDTGAGVAKPIIPGSASSSRMLLPILQPSLRIILSCLENVKGVAVVVRERMGEETGKETDSLHSILVGELSATITAATVGLTFPNARDVCLNTLSVLRKCLKKIQDDSVAMKYCNLFVTTMSEMQVRYISEQRKREIARTQAYVGADIDSLNETSQGLLQQKEAANGDIVETLLMGNTLLHTLGWNNFEGLGEALDACCREKVTNENIQEKVKAATNDLSKYLDEWDERQVKDDEESELVELFDTKATLGSQFDTTSRVHISSYASAADSMTSFIELASTESNRRSEIQSVLFPSRRYNCLSFAEKLAWKAFMEIFYFERMHGQIFERCMADGGRDYGARLISVPIHPQFSRTIPRQLDNSLFPSTSGEINDDEIDLDGLNSLVQQGSLKIVDITKKQENDGPNIEEDDSMDGSGNVLVSKPSIDSEEVGLLTEFDDDSGDLYLGFPERTGEGEIVEKHDDGQDQSKDDEREAALAVSDGPQDDLEHDFCMSTFANPPNTSSSSLHGHGSVQNAHAASFGGHGAIDLHYDSVLHIKAEGSRKGTMFLTPTYLILEYEDGLYEGESLLLDELKKKAESDENPNDSRRSHLIQHYSKLAAMRPKSVRWNLSELSHVYLRRYRLRDSSLEMFFIPSGGNPTDGPGLSSAMSSIYLDFGPGDRRDEAANAIMTRAPPSTVKQWPEKSGHFLHEHLRNITIGWVKGRVSNFDYLMALNCLSGRSFNDLCQYPVFPWVLSNYTSEDIPDLSDESNYRDLTKPMGALNPQRLEEFLERFETFDDPIIPPFMYGSHYSTSAGVVLHFLVRMHPFASLHRQLQSGHFDVADRLFNSVPRTWDMCTGQSAAEVKELTPEWYCNPSFLRNQNNFKLGASQDGEVLGDVELPPWAKGSPDKFVEVMRCALESDICTKMLPDWIDLIFGRKQQGPEAVEANNVFFYLTYYGSCDVARIEDEDLRKATELQIAHFGQCPRQLFWRPHVKKLPRSNARRRLSLSEMLGVYDLDMLKIHSNTNRQLPFESAPISHWVHLFAPPPGPHAPLIALRLVFPDRCVAVDAQGIFHSFRWAWKANVEEQEQNMPARNDEYNLFTDSGYFVAQRELPTFRSVPRLRYAPPKPPGHAWTDKKDYAVVAISKCLFASQSLVVVSDGDGKGGICCQLLDPSKGVVQGEVCISAVHTSRISAIHMDPIGTAAGVGGAGGELAIIGSDDGTASVWRFITNASYHLPLRPRLRFGGHQGNRIHAVAVNSSLNVCATVSDVRCCIFNLSNGNMVRSIAPPIEDLSGFSGQESSTIEYETRFVSSNAVCINNSGFITLVCESKFRSTESSKHREIISLQLFTLEGVHVGSKALEAWRGIPNKITATNDGKAIMVCSGRGISIHLISAIKPLHFIDEWQIGGDDDTITAAHDIDFGPSPSRPIVACTGLSSGALRIHALKGISEWSEENKKGTVTEAVGSVLGTVKGTGSKMVGLVKGTVGLGTELGGETVRGMRMKGVTGFLGDVFGKKIDP